MDIIKKNVSIYDITRMAEMLDKKIVFVLTATWCEPCHRWMHYLSKLEAIRSDIKVLQMDIDIPTKICKEVNPTELPCTLVLTPNGLETVISGINYDQLNNTL